MSAEPVDLVGPHGFTHGWVYHGPGRGSTSRRVSGIVRGAKTQQRGGMSASELADRATKSITGRRASDYQHLAAGRLHARAARQTSGARAAHHLQMAKMHRGIASRTPGKGTSTERRLQRTAGSQLAPASARRAANQKLAARGLGSFSTRGSSRPSGQRGKMGKTSPAAAKRGPAALRSGETRAPSAGKTQGPNVGELGKASYGSHRLPKGSAALTKEGRAKAYSHGHALPPPSAGSPHGFPVTDAKSWENARKAVGRVGSPQRKALLKALLRRTAAQYGKTAALKKSWAASNTGPALEMAMDRYPKLAVTSPYDVMVIRSPDGQAIIRHRQGGYEIARLRREPDGSWVAAVNGRDLPGHTRQRGALLEAIGIHNRSAGTPYHRPEPEKTEPLQPPPAQTALMQAVGLEPIRLATPARGSSDGPRVSGSGAASDVAGLSPRGATIYSKLRKRNFPHARAHAFARRAQNRVAGK
jgi:hypothetical protein